MKLGMKYFGRRRVSKEVIKTRVRAKRMRGRSGRAKDMVFFIYCQLEMSFSSLIPLSVRNNPSAEALDYR
jgi:hypothetical protein